MEIENRIRKQVPLAPYTTLGIGGAARCFIQAPGIEILAEAVAWAREKSLPVFLLGGGSNIVVADSGFPGLVIQNCIQGYEIRAGDNRLLHKGDALAKEPLDLPAFHGDEAVFITIGAGVEWLDFVRFCVAQNFAGVECLAGIPGTAGATPIQNVGAYGQEVSETIVTVEAFDLQTSKRIKLSVAECTFGYRTSRFKAEDRDRFIVTKVTYRLIPNGRPAIRYPELQQYLEAQAIVTPTLPDVSRAVEAIRRRKAMVIDANDPDSRSVGSFFVNPTIMETEFAQVEERAAKVLRAGEKMPAFAAEGNRVKLSAAWLIERAGIARGYVYGNVGTSSKHALAIINRGGGTAREVVELAELIKRRVLDEFGVQLTPEPVFIGFE